MMAEFTFFSNRVERWMKDLSTLWGNLNVCPHLNHLELPCHSPAELISVSSFKVWGNIQDPHCDMAYLLVCLGNTAEDRQYRVSLVWVNPNQTRATTMEELVEILAICPSSGPNWTYTLVQLYKGSGHVPLPKGIHLGILPQGKAEETSCGQISQLDIHQLLSTIPQVVYSSGLNGYAEPAAITLPDSLSSGIRIIANEHPYLEIDIPSNGKSDTKVLPIGEVSIIWTTNTPKPSPNPGGSITTEVNHLIDQAIAEVSSCMSEQSSLEKITEAVATTSPPQKSEVIVPQVDTSSQASIEEAEGSLEDIPTNISPIAAVYSSGSASPLVDLSELQANVNRAIDNRIHLKRSLDVERKRATQKLGVILHQNESQGAASIAAAKAVCSQAVTEAKANCWALVMEAKAAKHHSIHAAEVTCSKAINDAEALQAAQAMMFKEEHNKFLQSLEE